MLLARGPFSWGIATINGWSAINLRLMKNIIHIPFEVFLGSLNNAMWNFRHRILGQDEIRPYAAR